MTTSPIVSINSRPRRYCCLTGNAFAPGPRGISVLYSVLLLSVMVVETASAESRLPQVVALYAGKAAFRSDGQMVVLKVGDEKWGMRLIEADSTQVVVEIDGEVMTLTPSYRIGSHFRQPPEPQKTLRIEVGSDSVGQYWIAGSVNGRPLNFLVDTGASVIALSSAMAKRMSIDYLDGQLGSVVTAQGRIPSYFIKLKRVTIADIEAHDVAAAVIEGGYPRNALLGMSFLSQLDLEQKDGVLVLQAR